MLVSWSLNVLAACSNMFMWFPIGVFVQVISHFFLPSDTPKTGI